MKTSLTLLLICLALIVGSGCDPMEHAHCDDTLLKKVPSPDGKLVIAIYNRSCSGGTGLYTYAEVEDPSVWFSWPRHAEVCFLVTLAGGYHQMDAVWKDNKHIEVSSADELDQERGYNISSQHEMCNDIAVTYNFKVKPLPPEQAPDAQTAAIISEILKQTEGCITAEFGSEHAEYLRSEFEAGRQRHALGLLCTNLWVEKCPVSKGTYALFETAAPKMSIEESCLKNLKPLVQE